MAFDPINRDLKGLPMMRVPRINANLESLGDILYVIGGEDDDGTLPMIQKRTLGSQFQT